MSDTKNDEKLRILQERLAQIKQKQDTPESISQQKEIIIAIKKTVIKKKFISINRTI